MTVATIHDRDLFDDEALDDFEDPNSRRGRRRREIVAARQRAGEVNASDAQGTSTTTRHRPLWRG